jgi:hydrogenase nickel incorporation protein HypA/HybF
MHEMGIVMEIIEIVRASIPADATGIPVARINVKIGKLSAVVPQSLHFCFQVATKDTDLAGAELAIEEIPLALRCDHCTHQWTAEQPVFVCPACQGRKVEMLSGRELDIDSIELMDKDEPHVDASV